MSDPRELSEEELDGAVGGVNRDKTKKGMAYYRCQYCPEFFESQKDLVKHMKQVHETVK